MNTIIQEEKFINELCEMVQEITIEDVKKEVKVDAIIQEEKFINEIKQDSYNDPDRCLCRRCCLRRCIQFYKFPVKK